MRDSAYRITLDIHDVSSQLHITMKKGDTARKLVFSLMENGKPYDIGEQCSAFVLIKHIDHEDTNTDLCTIRNADNTVWYNLNSRTTQYTGLHECELRLFGVDGKLLTSPRFTMIVNSSLSINTPTEDDISALQQVIAECNFLDANVEKDETGLITITITKKGGTKKTVQIFSSDELTYFANCLVNRSEEQMDEYFEDKCEDFATTYNGYVASGKTELDNYTTGKKSTLDSYYNTKIVNFDSHYSDKEDEFDSHVESSKAPTVNSIKNEAINQFNTIYTSRCTNFNNLANTKYADYEKLSGDAYRDYQTMSNIKYTEYNNNAESKLEDFDSHVGEFIVLDESKKTAKTQMYFSMSDREVTIPEMSDFEAYKTQIDNETASLTAEFASFKTQVNNTVASQSAEITKLNDFAEGTATGELKEDLADYTDGIIDSHFYLKWKNFFWGTNDNNEWNSSTGSVYKNRMSTEEVSVFPYDVVVSLVDYTSYSFRATLFNDYSSSKVAKADSNWKSSGSYSIPKNTQFILQVSAPDGKNPSVPITKDDLKTYLRMVQNGDINDLRNKTSDAEDAKEKAEEALSKCIAETTKNLVVNQPVFGNTAFLCVDLGQDVTFENGVVISFDANNLILTSVTSDIFTLRKNDGSNSYITGNDFYSYEGAHLTTQSANGRYGSHKKASLKSNVTFRYLFINYSSSRVSSGTITNLMLESGNIPTTFIPHNTGVDYIVRASVDDLEKSLKPYPSYWDNAITVATNTVRSKQVNVVSGDSFFFVTDQHWESNAQKSSKLIDYLARKLQIPTIASGGDIIKSHNTTLLGAFDEIRNYYDSFEHDGFTRILSTIGNHDLNINNNPDTSTYPSMTNLYNLMMKNCEVFTDTDGSPYGIVYDNESQKIRYIQFYYCGDSGYTTESANWLDTILKATESGWTVILFSHAYWNGENVDTAGTRYANLILSAMDEMSATVAIWMVGHNHADRNTTLTSSGGKTLLIVSSTTDAIGQNPPYTMTYGSDTEQAFDVVTIDTSSKTIYMTRVGAGSDRQFNY